MMQAEAEPRAHLYHGRWRWDAPGADPDPERPPTEEESLVSVASVARLLAAKLGSWRFELVSVDPDDAWFPDGTIDMFGHVVDERGQLYYFHTDWDRGAGRSMLGTWAPVPPEETRAYGQPDYRRALAHLGIAPSRLPG